MFGADDGLLNLGPMHAAGESPQSLLPVSPGWHTGDVAAEEQDGEQQTIAGASVERRCWVAAHSSGGGDGGGGRSSGPVAFWLA